MERFHDLAAAGQTSNVDGVRSFSLPVKTGRTRRALVECFVIQVYFATPSHPNGHAEFGDVNVHKYMI